VHAGSIRSGCGAPTNALSDLGGTNLDRLDREAIGDWSGIKGTHYHLVYALYLLLVERTPLVWFYAGNDLLAAPAPPPARGSGGRLGARVCDRDMVKDVWIQAKSGGGSWTPNRVCREVLVNFALNALLSDSNGRPYEIRLAAEGPVRQDALRKFAADPSSDTRTDAVLDVVVQQVAEAWGQGTETQVGLLPSVERVREVCLDVVRELSESESLPLDTIKAKLLACMTEQHGTQEFAERALLTLLGALLDAAGPEGQPLEFDEEWLSQALGFEVLPKGTFDIDVVRACDDQVGGALSGVPDWAPDGCVRRAELDEELDAFLAAPQSVFVLTGSADSGKTWGLARFAHERLHGCVRCWCSAFDLAGVDSLDALVHRQLSRFSTSQRSARETFDRWRNSTGGDLPPTFIVDDVRPLGDNAEFTRQLIGKLTHEAVRQDIKLILSVNDAVMAADRPTAGIEAGHIYQATEHKPASFQLAGLHVSEARAIAVLRLPTRRADSLVSSLAGVAGTDLPPIRIFALLCQEAAASGAVDSQGDPASTAIERDLNCRATAVATGLRIADCEARTLVTDVAVAVWKAGASGMTRREILALAQPLVPDKSELALFHLLEQGFVEGAGTYRLSESIPVANLIAQWATSQSNRSWVSQVSDTASSVPIEHLVATQRGRMGMWRTLVGHSASFAGAVCKGIGRRRDVTAAETGMVIGLTRRGGRSINFPPACEALGRLTAVSPLARSFVESSFLSGHPYEMSRAEQAIAYAFCVDPQWASGMIRQRIDEGSGTTFGRRDDRERWLRNTLEVLRCVPYPAGREEVVTLIAELGQQPAVVEWAGDILAELHGRWEVI